MVLKKLCLAFAGLSLLAQPVSAQKISALPAATAPTGAEVIPVVQGGATKGATIAQISSLSGVGDQVAAPVTNVTYAAGGAGSLSSTYYYNHTCVTALGETAPWPGTPSGLVLSSQQVTVTIPACGAGATGHRLYRSKAGGTEPKDTYLVTSISGAGATTYTDNAADGLLGVAANWNASNRGFVTDGIGIVAKFSDQTTAFGQGTGCGGYASSCFGYRAGANLSSGRRNSLYGVYSGENLTTGYENAFYGTHSGNGSDGAIGNACFGYGTCGLLVKLGNFNTAAGENALNMGGLTSGAQGGSFNVAIGFRTMYNVANVSNITAIGAYAGNYATTNKTLFIDSGGDRTSLVNAQDIGLIYGLAASTGQAQELRLNAPVRIGWGSATVSQLPACSASNRAFRAYVTDASVAYSSANVGTTVAGSGSNTAPVFCNGTNWVVG